MKRPFRLSQSFFTQSFLQIILAVLCIGFAIYFLRNEHLEPLMIKKILQLASIKWLGIGLIVTVFYLLLQGALYIFSFKTIGCNIGIKPSINLFLKRNFISTFLPAGTFTSLAFFENELDEYKLSKTQIRYGSFVFAFASMLSVFLVAIPAFALLLFNNQLRSIDLYGLFILIGVIVLLLLTGLGIKNRRGPIYRWIAKVNPTFISDLSEVQNQVFNKKQFINACLISLLIELTGVAHLYIAMMALGTDPSWESSFIGYVVMIIILSLSPFLKGLGAIEVSITYILRLYSKPTLTAAAITLLFRFFEFWIPFILGAIVLIFRKGNLLLRIFPALFLMLLGAVNLVSALTPADPERLHLLTDFLPLSVMEFSNIAVLLLGVIMIISSAFLLTGARNAWKLALIISTLSLIGNITKAIDYEEALVALTTISILIYTRKAYFVKHDIQFQLKSIHKIVIVISALVIYSVAGFYLLNTRHLGFNTTWSASLHYGLETILFLDYDLKPMTKMASYFVLSIQLGSATTIMYILYILFRPNRFDPEPDQEIDEAKYLVERFGNSALDYFKIYPDKRLFFNDAKDAFLSYSESRHYAMVLENPVAKDEQASRNLIQSFEDYTRERGLRTFYYRVGKDDLEFYHSLNKKSILLGQDAILDLETFNLNGNDKKSIRHSIKKVEQAGLRFNGYHEPLRAGLVQSLKAVSDEWLQIPGHSEAGFSQGVFIASKIKECTVLTVEDKEEKIFAFVNIIPSYTKGEATYDLIRHSKDAPNGTLDYLMIKMIEYFRDNEFKTLNLGMAPLAGAEEKTSLNEQVIRIYRDYFKQAARFKGLYEYKNKFGPRWENRYLIYDQLYDLVRLPRVLDDVSKKIVED
ncbi:MAG TPA: phosphatidylglycerol lysyltransferase domain-containing protein [Cyclobacteriaceae bacterium]|nr:phosphatidylglycerol lysyltransferase domain-containing protein [Cyclobacteriaceae bacterium]